jgi:hypothetical protein
VVPVPLILAVLAVGGFLWYRRRGMQDVSMAAQPGSTSIPTTNAWDYWAISYERDGDVWWESLIRDPFGNTQTVTNMTGANAKNSVLAAARQAIEDLGGTPAAAPASLDSLPIWNYWAQGIDPTTWTSWVADPNGNVLQTSETHFLTKDAALQRAREYIEDHGGRPAATPYGG